jgi:hypothetical protein
MRIRVDFDLPEQMVVAIIAKVLYEQGKATKASIYSEAREVMATYGYNWSDGFDIGSDAEEKHEETAQWIYDNRRWWF